MTEGKQTTNEQVTVRPGEANNKLRDALNMSEFNTPSKIPELPPDTYEYAHKLAREKNREATVELVLETLAYFSRFEDWRFFAEAILQHIRKNDAVNTARYLAAFLDGLSTVGVFPSEERQRVIEAVLLAPPEARVAAIPEPPEGEQVLAVMPPEEASDERGLTGEVLLSAMPPAAPPVYTLPELLSLAIADALKQKPEYSGRFCPLCNETTAHFRPRGRGPDYVKTMQWCCAPCFMPKGAIYEIVKSLMIRQGEIAK